MATSTSDMPLRGGHPALDFANTVDSRRGRCGPDFLRSFEDIVVLARRTGLIDDGVAGELDNICNVDPRGAAAALKEAVRLREAIYAVFLAEDAREPYPTDALDIVRTSAKKARCREVLTEADGSFRWLQRVTNLTDLTGLFAAAAADLMIGQKERRLIRECKGANCGWLFLDRSRSGRRIWCSDASCGTHERVKRFRDRRV